jgi:hypothetical protein
MVLLYFRNKALNKFQSILGILMFSENSSKSLQLITGRIGLAVANSSTLKRLYSMSTVASEKIRIIGANWVNKLASFHVVYDNINQYHKNWRPSLSSQTSMESGTAATLIMQPGVASDAFDGFEYEERRRHVKREDITLTKIWNDVDRKHLENVCIINILRLLLDYVPGLRRHTSDFDNLRQTVAIHGTPLQKTDVIPLETSGFDEATTMGNCQTIRDIVERQLGIPPHAVEGRLIPFSGDQATISRIRTLKRHTASGSSWFSSNRYILPLIELWHMKFAMLKGIIKAHWPEQTEKGDIGLRFAADKLRRNLNPNKVDFYPAERLIEVVLTAMTLNYIRCSSLPNSSFTADLYILRNMLRQKSLKCPVRQDRKSMHLTEELEAYTKKGNYLHSCSFEDLCQLVRETYHAFGSTRSGYMALSRNVSDARSYFAHLVDPQLDSLFPMSEEPSIASELVGDSSEQGDSNGDDVDDSDDEANGANEHIGTSTNIDLAFDDECLTFEMPNNASGDILMHNNAILWRDLLQYWEFKNSVKEGDIGRTFEVIKVRIVGN